MKIILSGGTNSTIQPEDASYDIYGRGNYFICQIIDELHTNKNSKTAVVVAAKEDRHSYDELLEDCGLNLSELTILSRGDMPDWGDYQSVLLLGGTTSLLYDWLKETNFDVSRLISCKLLAGDSAGAYVLGAKVIIDYKKDDTELITKDGFIPESNILVAAHVNNTYYHEDGLTARLVDYCNKNQLELVALEENQIKSNL